MKNLPKPGDYIDIHNHGGTAADGVFSVENLLASEDADPVSTGGMAFTIGIHPWHLTLQSYSRQMERVRSLAGNENIIALGEAGFDRLKGPARELQEKAFAEQVKLSGEHSKPLCIHCVKGWEELISAHNKLQPSMPWLVHGFRGKKELALQLVRQGMYISFWFGFILRPESSDLVRSLPMERIFLETDGSGTPISEIYAKAAADLNLTERQLKNVMAENFRTFFNI